ncbi:MAG: A/G-specific adenine glycosylase [Dysgonomonas sp.]
MRMEEDLRLSSILIDWYNVNRRDLPWRNTANPYLIWLSEVILQQTRVDQGYSYYNKFAERYPTVELLANAEEDEVLKLWQGLGYYGRARNLHSTAKFIVREYNGVFPSRYKDVLSLKGIGEYTAAAIVSFAYNQAYAVVDGNVYRVLSRVFAIDEPIDSSSGKRLFSELATTLLDDSNAGLHNQAIMEFGALQCTPVSPDCVNCPASSLCLAYDRGEVGKYPVKAGKVKNRSRYFNYFDIRVGGFMYLHKRTDKDIWQGLYELPLVESDRDLMMDELSEEAGFRNLFSTGEIQVRYITKMKHVLSHQTIYAIFYQVEIPESLLVDDRYLKIKIEEVDLYPVSRLSHKYLEAL